MHCQHLFYSALFAKETCIIGLFLLFSFCKSGYSLLRIANTHSDTNKPLPPPPLPPHEHTHTYAYTRTDTHSFSHIPKSLMNRDSVNHNLKAGPTPILKFPPLPPHPQTYACIHTQTNMRSLSHPNTGLTEDWYTYRCSR